MPSGLYLLLGFVMGGLLGLIVGWLYARSRGTQGETRVEAELRQQLTQRESELTLTRAQLSEAGTAKAALETRESLAAERVREKEALAQQLEAEIVRLRDELAAALKESSTATAQLKAERESAAQIREERGQAVARLQALQADLLAQKELNGKLEAQAKFLQERLDTEKAQIESLQQKFQKDFEAVAHKLLVENSSRFGQQSAENLEKLLAPLRENLQDYKSRLEVVHQQNVEHSALLKDQIGRIGTEAANLSKALKGDVKALGNWGENMLDQILDKSGLQLGLHYRRQASGRGEEGEQRYLDVVVELPENKHLVIDSKVSLKAYEEHVNCADDNKRLQYLQNHVDSLRNHIRGLGGKRYQETLGITAPDFVLMYIPLEAAFFAAIGNEPGLFSEALDKNVVLTTNSTLLATLRTVAHVWRLADQQKNALEIAERGGKLYDKFVAFISDLKEVGEAIEYSREKWAEATKKLSTGAGNLVRQAETLRALGVKAAKALPAELVAQADAPALPPITGNGEETQPGN